MRILHVKALTSSLRLPSTWMVKNEKLLKFVRLLILCAIVHYKPRRDLETVRLISDEDD
jgi:hypothetical protein